MNKSDTPSEQVVAEALRLDLPEHLLQAPRTDLLSKVIFRNIDPDRTPRWLDFRKRAA